MSATRATASTSCIAARFRLHVRRNNPPPMWPLRTPTGHGWDTVATLKGGIEEAFSKWGSVSNLDVPVDDDGVPRGFAFFDLAATGGPEVDVETCLERINASAPTVCGSEVLVNRATPQYTQRLKLRNVREEVSLNNQEPEEKVPEWLKPEVERIKTTNKTIIDLAYLTKPTKIVFANEIPEPSNQTDPVRQQNTTVPSISRSFKSSFTNPEPDEQGADELPQSQPSKKIRSSTTLSAKPAATRNQKAIKEELESFPDEEMEPEPEQEHLTEVSMGAKTRQNKAKLGAKEFTKAPPTKTAPVHPTEEKSVSKPVKAAPTMTEGKGPKKSVSQATPTKEKMAPTSDTTKHPESKTKGVAVPENPTPEKPVTAKKETTKRKPKPENPPNASPSELTGTHVTSVPGMENDPEPDTTLGITMERGTTSKPCLSWASVTRFEPSATFTLPLPKKQEKVPNTTASKTKPTNKQKPTPKKSN
ncbi:hypothetical protein Pelo_841 [Pelomyxa schiedti]|nr:hypothetical protein Pelo_841 [Pelomyxa schiedti]